MKAALGFPHGTVAHSNRTNQGGLPGAKLGLQAADPCVARTSQAVGLCHRAIRQEPSRRQQRVLPTVHGFDEFFGNLYHLNAEEEPENADYPKDPAFRAKFAPRGVLRTKATDKDDPTADPSYGRV